MATDTARETVRKEAAEHLKGVHDQLMGKHTKVSAEAEALFEKNKTMKHLSEEDINAIKEQLKYAKKEVGKILISESDPLRNVTKVGKEVNTVSGYIDSISTRISVMDDTLDTEKKRREEEAERKKKEEKRKRARQRLRGQAFATKGGSKKSAKGKKESKETKEGLTEFLSDKNLEEKKVSAGYEYSLGRPDVVKNDVRFG